MTRKTKPLILLLIFFVLIFFVALSLFVSKDSFLAHADFQFPLQAETFVQKHTNLWNEINGSVGVDSNIRVLSRALFFLAFQIFQNNVAFSYFFIFVHLLAVFGIGYLYLRSIIGLHSTTAKLLALYFVFNPVFLGNFSKLGLVFAASLLPLIFWSIKKYFKTKVLAYLLGLVLLLNFSFVHPFTFLINLMVAAVIYGYYFFVHWRSFLVLIKHFVIAFVTGLLVNLYFLVPIFRYSLFEKSVISNSTGASGDANFLYNIANTHSILESFTLSKDVFVEYRFYTDNTRILYYIGYILVYICIISCLITVQKHIIRNDKKTLLFSITVFFLLALITRGGDISKVQELYDLIQSLPGGWAFRSPLKWQLYQPITLVTVLAIVLKYRLHMGKFLRNSIYITIVGMLLLNGVLIADLYTNLLVPKSFNESIANLDFRNAKVLFQNDVKCREEIEKDKVFFDNLKYKITNEARLFKTLNQEELLDNYVYFSNFDFVILCGDTEENSNVVFFEQKFSHEDPLFAILENQVKRREVYTINQDIRSNNIIQQDDFEEYDPETFVISNEDRNYNLIDLFEDGDTAKYSSFSSLRNIELLYNYDLNSGALELYYQHIGDLYNNNELIVTSQPILFDTLDVSLENREVVVDGVKYPVFSGFRSLGVYDPREIRLTYYDTMGQVQEDVFTVPDLVFDAYPINSELRLTYENESGNLIENSSFENKSWQETVGDCFNYDDSPDIGMGLSDKYATKGDFSLELSARRHVACVSQDIEIEPNKVLNLSVDTFGESGLFDLVVVFSSDENQTISRRFVVDGEQTATEYIPTPKDALEATIYLQVPQTDLITENKVYFDNVEASIGESTSGLYYYRGYPKGGRDSGGYISNYEKNSSTSYNVTIAGDASSEVVLVLEQGYNPHWQIITDTKAIDPVFEANYLFTGWRLNINDLCMNNPVCVHHEDGVVHIPLSIEYRPQRLFTRSLFLSSVVMIIMFGYIGYYFYKRSYE